MLIYQQVKKLIKKFNLFVNSKILCENTREDLDAGQPPVKKCGLKITPLYFPQ